MPLFRDLMIYLVVVAMLVAFNICLFTCFPLMEEILHYLGCMKPCKHWDKLLTSTGEPWISEPSTMCCAKCQDLPIIPSWLQPQDPATTGSIRVGRSQDLSTICVSAVDWADGYKWS